MAEVIGKAWRVRDWRHETMCSGCRSTIAFGVMDLERDEFKIGGNHFDGTAVCQKLYYGECPVCDRMINVPDSEIWPEVARRVQELGRDHS